MDFIFKPKGKKSKIIKPEDVSFLNSLPFAIKHSLFFESNILEKIREMDDVGELLFLTDDTKI